MKNNLSTFFALILVIAGFGFLFFQAPVVGRIEGTVVLPLPDRPFADAVVTLQSLDSAEPSRRVKTDKNGHFSASHLAVGRWMVSAEARSHSVPDQEITVTEAHVSRVTLTLKRDEEALNIGSTRQRIFSTKEEARLPIQGYAQPNDKLHIALYRTRLSEIYKDPKAAEALNDLGSHYEKTHAVLPPVLSPFAKVLVGESDQPIRRINREGFFTDRVRLDKIQNKPGLYLAHITLGKASTWGWVLTTNLAMIVQSGADGKKLVYTVDMETGNPRAGATITHFQSGKPVATATTSANGIGWFRSESTVGYTVAALGDDEAVVRGGENYGDRGTQFVTHTITDRPLYRPGHTVQYKTVVRRRTNPQDRYSYSLPSGVSAQVIVTDPAGTELSRTTQPLSATGALTGSFEIGREALTGVYTITTELAGERHTADVSVASYKKPEFEVTVTPKQKRYRRGEEVEVTVEASYYFGAPVANGILKYYINSEADWSAEYLDTSAFDDDEALESPFGGNYYGEFLEEKSVRLDQNGRAVVHFTASEKPNEPHSSRETAPQALNFSLSATVTDDAKRTVSEQTYVLVTSSDLRVNVEPEGYVGEPGKPTNVIASVRNFDGVPQPGVSVSIQPSRETYNKETSETTYEPFGPALSATTGADGRAIVSYTPTRSGSLQLEASTHDSAGRESKSRAALWVARDTDTDLDTENDDLSIQTDKKNYQKGETARVLISAARTGQTALLTVESETILQALTIPLPTRSVIYRLPIQESWGPNVSLGVRYIQSKKYAHSETPIRVRVPNRVLSVTVKPQKAEYRPGERAVFDIAIKDALGKPVSTEFAFSVVDEAIYALADDDPKALQRAFYPRRENSVSTSHSFELTYLAGDEKDGPVVALRKKFLDTAQWNPTATTDANGHATLSVPLPDNLTTWRATVNAVTALGTAVGYGKSTIIVNKPFFVRLEAPRFVVQGDQTRLLALVHNNSGAAQTVHLALEASGILPKTEKTLSVAAGTVGQVDFPITAAAPTDSTVKLTAWTEDRALTDGVEVPLIVRPFGRGVVTAIPASSALSTFTISEAAIPSRNALTIRVAPTVGVAISSSLDYLIGFPYGCTEQTLSRFLPDVIASRTNPALLSPEQRATLPKMVRDGLTRLGNLQHPSGAWGWWTNDRDDLELTALVVAGLAEAQAAGYSVPESLRQSGARALETAIRTGKSKSFVPAIAYYSLARSGHPELPREWLRQIATNPRALAPDSLAYAVLTEHALGDPHGPFLMALRVKAKTDNGLTFWETTGKYVWQNNRRDQTALALRAFLAASPDDVRIPSAVRYLMSTRTGSYFGHTRDTALVVQTLCDYLARFPATSAPTETAQVFVNGSPIVLQRIQNAPGELIAQVPADRLKPGKNELRVVGAGYWSASLKQTLGADPKSGVLAPIKPDNVVVGREFRRLASGPKGLVPEAAATTFAQGDVVLVRVTVENPMPLEYVLIEDVFPAGFEPSARGTADEEITGNWNWWYSNVDVRDDKIAVFARDLPAGKHTFEYHLRAQTPGSYRALPASMTPMYAPVLRAESRDTQLVVK